MDKNEVLEKYFLTEVENSGDENVKGWRIIGKLKDYQSSGGCNTVEELVTQEDGWFCEFGIKILGGGFVLVSPECPDCYMKDDEELMEIMEELMKSTYVNAEDLNDQILKILQDPETFKINQPNTINPWTTTTSPPSWLTSTTDATRWYYDSNGITNYINTDALKDALSSCCSAGYLAVDDSCNTSTATLSGVSADTCCSAYTATATASSATYDKATC